VFKNGELIARRQNRKKLYRAVTHVARPDYDKSIEKSLADYFSRYHTMSLQNFKVQMTRLSTTKGSIVAADGSAKSVMASSCQHQWHHH
jgi:formylmethanofuran dehydrogenase subunit A